MAVYLKYFLFFREEEEAEDFPKEWAQKLVVFKDVFPENIVAIGRKKPFSKKLEYIKFELQANSFTEGTWHEQPVVEGSAKDGKEKLSNWNKRVDRGHFPKFSTGGTPTNAVPKDISGDRARDNMPRGMKVSFSKFDDAYEKFLSGPQLVKDNEVEIDGPFSDGPNYVKVNVDQNMVKAERFSREAIRDCFGVTTMLQMLLKRLEKGSNGELDKDGDPWDPESEIKLTMEWLEIVLQSCYRTGALLQSIQVMTKDSIRQETLEHLHGHKNTIKDLRYSNYAVDNIFGPLSTDFEPHVSPSNYSHYRYKLAPRYDSVSSKDKGFNRPSTSGRGQYKRGSNPKWGNPMNKRGRLSNNYSINYSNNNVKEISAQEALRRARQNSGGQVQNFRGRGGRGRKFRGPWNRNAKRGGYHR